MAITEIPTVATFGGPKESLRALAESAKRQSSANQNAVNEWLVKLATAVGEDDGSTSGSLRAGLAELFVALTTLAARIDELEAPTPGDANAGTYSWTTAPELFVSEDSVEVDITLDGDTGEWPENTSRLVAIDNDGGFGFNLGVPSGHTLNGITNGNSGTLGDVARAANAAVFSVLVTRRGSTSWIWR